MRNLMLPLGLVSLLLIAACAPSGTATAPSAPSAPNSATTPSTGNTPSTANGGTAVDAASLVKDRCTRCHALERIKAASHDQVGWTATVSRMQGKGAKVDGAEAAAIVDFLASGGAAKL